MTQPQDAANDSDAVRVPLRDWMRAVATEAAAAALTEHYERCPVADIEKRLRRVETRAATLWGFMAGSGFLGGAAGALLSSFLP